MIRNPLMLSDTAMVLLREYCEMITHKVDVFDALRDDSSLSPDEDLTPLFQRWHRTVYPNPSRTSQVHYELLQEIWLLWTFPDVVPIRSLEWHFILDAPLMKMAEERFSSLSEYSLRHPGTMSAHVIKHDPYPAFMDVLGQTYREVADARTAKRFVRSINDDPQPVDAE